VAEQDPTAGNDGVLAGRVVVGVDGSPDSADALVWAAHEARLRGARLEVVYALFFRSELLEQYPDLLEKERSIPGAAVARAQELEPALETTSRTADPPPAKALVEASVGADLLVVGARGLGGFKRLELGSVSQQCAHHAFCPVVIVRPPRSQD
jgi:nucleotide-binding universal stress UspA family protein